MSGLNVVNQREDGLPIETLHDLPRWVGWRFETRNNSPTKIPYSPTTGGQAAVDEPATWGNRDAAERLDGCLARYEGTGIVLGQYDPEWYLGGIDLDSCRDKATGRIEEWALDIVRTFRTYTEVSPSGTGLKVFFRFSAGYMAAIAPAMGDAKYGKVFKRGGGEHAPSIELYLSHRYFTVTGQRLGGVPEEVHVVFLEEILHLIRVTGPKFAGGTLGAKHEAPAEAPRPLPSDGMPEGLWGRIQTKGAFSPALQRLLSGDFSTLNDRSRSGLAMAMGCALVRSGFTFDEMVQALRTWPQTAEWTTEKGEAGGGRELQRIWQKANTDSPLAEEDEAPTITVGNQQFPLNEDGIAQAFAVRHAKDLKYCHDTGKWYQWSGHHWQEERTKLAFSWARELCRQLVRSGDLKAKVEATIAKASTAAAVERYAQADRAFAVTAAVWDEDKFLLGTPGGTVDLRTGLLREAEQGDMITRVAAVAPADVGAACPLWMAFLEQATKGDQDMITWLKRWFGYCLTGSTREHALFFGYGKGGNGKSVLLNTMARILGDYAVVAAMETFTASHGDKHPTDLAMLRGARLVTATETEEGRAWAESRIKQITGGDPVSARFMRQDFFTYIPQFKLTIVGNNKPVLRNVDDAARRRFNIVPFLHKPEKKDVDLEAKLEAEWPAILRWMIDGCLEWQAEGLKRPKVIEEATSEYFAAQDYFARWLNECCILDPTLSSKPATLLASFQQWTQENGEAEPDNRRLRGMIERTEGLRYVTTKGTQWVRGVGIRKEDQ